MSGDLEQAKEESNSQTGTSSRGGKFVLREAWGKNRVAESQGRGAGG